MGDFRDAFYDMPLKKREHKYLTVAFRGRVYVWF